MRRLLLTAVVALLIPAPAAAKELEQVEVCGGDGCNTITDRDEMQAIASGAETTMPPPAAGSFYSVELTVQEDVQEHSWTIWYAPAANAVAVLNESENVAWHPLLDTDAAAAMRRAARGLEPFPAPRLTSVRIGSRVITKGAQSYLGLFTQPAGDAVADASLTDWVQVDLRSARPTPWTASDAEFAFSEQGQALERSWELVALPESTAEAIAAGKPLRPAGDGRTLLPWLLLAGLAGGIVLLAGLGRLLRPTPTPEPV